MTVYVDNMRAQVGRHQVCHMMADTEAELEAMAQRIGLSHRWRHGDHFDVPLDLRARAVESGAVEITQREMVRVRQRNRAPPLTLRGAPAQHPPRGRGEE